jgi:small subunit ribosomal protein S16
MIISWQNHKKRIKDCFFISKKKRIFAPLNFIYLQLIYITMPARIRLQRKGKKGQPFYHLVVADGRAPRDGKFIERLGTYNPMTHPATIEINFERTLHWVQVGAQPSDTARSLLSHKGVYLKHHLLQGVQKGALTEDQVEEKFNAWLTEKQDKLSQAKKDKELSSKELHKKRLEEEKRVDEARVSELAKKRLSEQKRATASQDTAEEEATENEEAAAEPESEA